MHQNGHYDQTNTFKILRGRKFSLFILHYRTTLLAFVMVCLYGTNPLTSALGSETAAGMYPRPDPSEVRAEVRNILNDPRFAQHVTFRQWLEEQFMNWKAPDVDLPEWLKLFLSWAFMIWCVLTLLAILAHFIWTLFILLRRKSAPSGNAARAGLTEKLRHRSLEELMTTIHQLAGRGSYREALEVMMLALLKSLDQAGAIRYHESKTNGEYLFEYSPDRPERSDFRQFVTAVEGTIYGGRECGPDHYRGILQLFERIHTYAEQKP
jgi:hypothetical protein